MTYCRYTGKLKIASIRLLNVYLISTALRRSFLNIAVFQGFLWTRKGHHGRDALYFQSRSDSQAGKWAFQAAKGDERLVFFDPGRRGFDPRLPLFWVQQLTAVQHPQAL